MPIKNKEHTKTHTRIHDNANGAEVVFSRNSIGTYWRHGELKLAGPQEPRFETDKDGNALGLLVESSSTFYGYDPRPNDPKDTVVDAIQEGLLYNVKPATSTNKQHYLIISSSMGGRVQDVAIKNIMFSYYINPKGKQWTGVEAAVKTASGTKYVGSSKLDLHVATEEGKRTLIPNDDNYYYITKLGDFYKVEVQRKAGAIGDTIANSSLSAYTFCLDDKGQRYYDTAVGDDFSEIVTPVQVEINTTFGSSPMPTPKNDIPATRDQDYLQVTGVNIADANTQHMDITRLSNTENSYLEALSFTYGTNADEDTVTQDYRLTRVQNEIAHTFVEGGTYTATNEDGTQEEVLVEDSYVKTQTNNRKLLLSHQGKMIEDACTVTGTIGVGHTYRANLTSKVGTSSVTKPISANFESNRVCLRGSSSDNSTYSANIKNWRIWNSAVHKNDLMNDTMPAADFVMPLESNLTLYNGNAKWTPNYNGVNSYVEIPEWKPTGKFEIEVDVYASRLDSAGEYILDDTTDSPNRLYLIMREGRWELPAGVSANVLPKIGFNHFKITGTSGGLSARQIGRRFSNSGYFKGQISNLRLTDLDNPSNSRYYPGIVYTYEDPYSPTVSMPSSTVLVDENNIGKQVWDDTKVFLNGEATRINDTTYRLLSTGSFSGVWLRLDGSTNYSLAGKVVKLSYDILSHNGGDIALGNSTSSVVVLDSSVGSHSIICSSDVAVIKRVSKTDTIISNIRLEEVTHGVMTNFGTTQPYVPLLGDREEYCGDYNRGQLQLAWVSSYSRDGRTGSFYKKNLAGSILRAGGISVSCTQDINDHDKRLDITKPVPKEVQHAFQYPNTFKVIKPTDSDYEGYK